MNNYIDPEEIQTEDIGQYEGQFYGWMFVSFVLYGLILMFAAFIYG